MKRLLLLAIACAACGTSTRKCKSGTVFATLSFDTASARADSLDVALSLDRAPVQHTTVTRGSGATSTLEIDFSKYSSGSTLDITIVASAGTSELGSGHVMTTLFAGCTSLSIPITGADLGADLAGEDFAGEDFASSDLFTPDLTNCPLMLVSPTGTDGNDGCTPATAVKTIAYGVNNAAGREVHVCAGTYNEQNLLVSGVVRGGYDCMTWTRTAGYGYPSFDGTNETIVTNGSYPTSSITLTANSDGATVEGLTIMGAASGTTASTAMFVSASTISVFNNKIIGGGTSTTTGTGSTGLEIAGGSGDFYNNSINGGSGTTTSMNLAPDCGSLGLFVGGAGSPHVHDNTINGGSGMANGGNASGSIGVVIDNTGNLVGSAAFERNTIRNGTGGGSSGRGTYGIMVDPGAGVRSVDVQDNDIDGDVPTNSGGSIPLYSGTQGNINIRRNRIFGGSPRVDAAIMQYRNSTGTRIENNMIHLGTTTTAVNEGISVQTTNAVIVHNTIVFGDGTQSNAKYGIQTISTGTVIENNIIASSGGSFTTAYVTSGPGLLASLKNNLTFSVPTILTDNGSSYSTVQAMEAAEGSIASGNRVLNGSSCTGDSGCIVVSGCSTAVNCLSTIFGAWDATTDGKSNLFGTGWKLSSNVPCLVSKSSLDDTATVPVDLFMTARTSPPSMGAHEYDGTCQ